ncbi:putative gustatory receptor 28a [Anopheles maculipalpis]|uniref:putative gustatory receptor 28a n=1 Tax=Anopheles maculipalpis TaxID=1496333 RepID=UPI002158B634|nr:putative gustatory receptor 28a [Anopheles maculipalpis]
MEKPSSHTTVWSKIIGLQLYNSYAADADGRLPSLSIIRLLYSIILFGGYLVGFYKTVEMMELPDPNPNSPSIFKFAYMTQIYSSVLGTFICYASLWRTDRMKCVFVEGIQSSNTKINDRYYQFRNMQVPAKQSILVPLSIGLLFILSLCEGYAQYNLSNYFTIIAIVYPLWMFHVTILEFTTLVKSTECIVTKLNWMLDAFLESLHRQSTPIVPAKGETNALNKVYPISRRPYVSEHELISGERLTYLFVIHENVAKLAEFINRAYSLQLIAIVTVTFVNTLFGFFIETKLLFWNYEMLDLILRACRYAFECIPACLLIYNMLVVCAATHTELFKSASLLHKLLQYKANYFIDDQALFERSKAIALQLLHRKRFPLFDGSGLFRLDFTFIFSVFSAATSYLIVLLQFDLTKDLEKAVV